MNTKYQEFMESFSSENTIKVLKSLSKIGDYDYTNCDVAQLENIILSFHPSGLKDITVIRSIMLSYANFIGDNHLKKLVKCIDRKDVLNKLKLSGHKKFISHKDFKNVYKDIGIWEEHNSLYYQTLFWCIYEGIYNKDMSVLKNLRAKDIDGDTVTLREDNGHSYNIKIPQQLADDLIELSQCNIWEFPNRYGVAKIKISGTHNDSCFKMERRNEDCKTTFKFGYYRKLRKIAKDYLGYNLLPQQIFTSGIMYRIRLKLEENNITLEEAFSFNCRKRLVTQIISDELNRCNYSNIRISNFRMNVAGYIDVFQE